MFVTAPLTQFTGATSGLTDGVYQASFSASATSVGNCDGDANSQATISGSTISFATCVNSDTASK